MYMFTNSHNPLPWHTVEAAIQRERHWLLESFDFGSFAKETDSISSLVSEHEMVRQLCVAIVSGTVKSREIKSEVAYGLWIDGTKDYASESIPTTERHGEEWHRIMMHIIKKHFTEEGLEVVNEPFLNHGRADLGVYQDGFLNMYVEIGTTSLYKTWVNLLTMPNATFLFVPSAHYALEFKTSANHITDQITRITQR